MMIDKLTSHCPMKDGAHPSPLKQMAVKFVTSQMGYRVTVTGRCEAGLFLHLPGVCHIGLCYIHFLSFVLFNGNFLPIIMTSSHKTDSFDGSASRKSNALHDDVFISSTCQLVPVQNLF